MKKSGAVAAVRRRPEDVAAMAAGASSRVAGAGDDDIDFDGDWAGLAPGGDTGDLPRDAGFGDLVEDAYSGALAGAIDARVASGGADCGVEREGSKLDGREGCM